jgi:hypothetical protein
VETYHFSGSVQLDIKDIHLALEVKTFFSNSTTGDGVQYIIQHSKPKVPTDGHQRHRRKRERERPAHKSYKAKLE